MGVPPLLEGKKGLGLLIPRSVSSVVYLNGLGAILGGDLVKRSVHKQKERIGKKKKTSVEKRPRTNLCHNEHNLKHSRCVRLVLCALAECIHFGPCVGLIARTKRVEELCLGKLVARRCAGIKNLFLEGREQNIVAALLVNSAVLPVAFCC